MRNGKFNHWNGKTKCHAHPKYNNDYSRHNNQNVDDGDGGNDDDDDDDDQVFTPVCSLDQQLIFPNQCQAKCAGQLITRIIDASSK